MKKSTLVLLAITLYVVPVRAAEEVVVPESINEDLYAYLADILSNTDFNNSTEFLLRSFLLSDFNPSIYENNMIDFPTFATNLYARIQSFQSAFNAYKLSAQSNILQIKQNLQNHLQPLLESGQLSVSNLNELVNFIKMDIHPETRQYYNPFNFMLYETFFNDKPYYFGTNLFYTLDNLYTLQNANTYSNLLAQYLQSYTNKLETSYSVISNALYKSSPWTGNSALWKMHLEEQYDFNPLSSFGSELPSDYLIYTNPDAAYMQFIQALQNATGYNSFNNLIGSSTVGGLVGYWNYDIPGVQVAQGMLEDAKSFFTAGNWADKNFDTLRDEFERHFGVKIQDKVDRMEDVFKRNEIIRDAALAGNIKPMADDIKKIADSVASNTNKEILVEMNQNISNVVVAINALEGFVFPESVISNLDELVNREDEYETTWRGFYSPTSIYNIQREVDNLEQEFRHAELKTAEISNKVQRTVATLLPENAGLSRFMKKVKNFTQRNVVSHIPERIQILDTEPINTFLRYHSDTIQFAENAYFLDTDYEIYQGLRISDIIEGIRDISRLFYAAMGLYFGYKLTMVFLLIMSRTVQYLGIYLNIKALQIK